MVLQPMCCTSCNKVARSESTSALHVNSQASFDFNPSKECYSPPWLLIRKRKRDSTPIPCLSLIKWSGLSYNSTLMSKGAPQDTRLPWKLLTPHQPLLYMLEAPCSQLRHASTSSSLSCRKTWVSCRITLAITLQPWILGERLKMF